MTIIKVVLAQLRKTVRKETDRVPACMCAYVSACMCAYILATYVLFCRPGDRVCANALRSECAGAVHDRPAARTRSGHRPHTYTATTPVYTATTPCLHGHTPCLSPPRPCSLCPSLSVINTVVRTLFTHSLLRAWLCSSHATWAWFLL